jgi:DNA-binding NarL/FixJ family response regulator
VLNIFVYDHDPSIVINISNVLESYPFVERVTSAVHPSEALVRLRRSQIDLVFWGFHKDIALERRRRDQALKDQPMQPIVNLVDLNRADLIETIFNPLSIAVMPRISFEENYRTFFDCIFFTLPTLNPQHLALNQPDFTYRELMFFRAIALGYENQEISQRLGVEYETVRSNLKTLSRQMKTLSRAHLVAAGFRNKVLH